MGLNCCKPRRELPASPPPDIHRKDPSPPPDIHRKDPESSDLPYGYGVIYLTPSTLRSEPSLESVPLCLPYGYTPDDVKTPSWGKDLNNIPDTNDWRQAERSIVVNAPTISAPPINEPPISEPRIHFISESEPIRMTISTEESGKQETGSSESTPSLPEVKSLFDDGKPGVEKKTFKLHGKSPELPSHNSNKGLLESRNTDYISATTPGLLGGKGEFESHKYTSIEVADNKSVLYQARRLDKSSSLEKIHKSNKYEIDSGDEKEHEIKKKTPLSDQRKQSST